MPNRRGSILAVLWTIVATGLVAWAIAYLIADPDHGGGESDDLVPQWLLGRLVDAGYGPLSYDYATQATALNVFVDWDGPSRDNDTAEYRRTRLPPHRVELLTAPQIQNLGACPYPPTAAMLYAPLGRLLFTEASEVFRLISLGLTAVAIVLLWRVGGGHIGLLTCAALMLYNPCFYYVLVLGQNSFITLTLLTLGWTQLVAGRTFLAGLVWGLLAYKAHWILAVGWLPLALGRPKAVLGMAVSAGLFALAATYVVGYESWGLWLGQVRRIDTVYAFDDHFRRTILLLGCDLRSLAYRLAPYLPAQVVQPLGWSLLGGVVVVTWLCHWRRPNPTALTFGCVMAAPHLYYYDELLVMWPLVMLWSRRAYFTRWQWVVATLLSFAYYAGMPLWQALEFRNPPIIPLVVIALWLLSLTLREPT